jgi:hypothetical protein
MIIKIKFKKNTFQQFLARHGNHPKCCPVWFPIIFLCSNFPPPVFWARYLVCLVHNSKTGPKHDHLDMLPFLYVRVTLPWLVESFRVIAVSCQELLKCGCNKENCSNRCKCYKAGLSCTTLCSSKC